MKQNKQTNSDSLQLINDLEFCVFDLETTGGSHQRDKIIEVGLVKVQNLKITDEMSFLIDPEIPIPEFIQKLTSIKQDDLKGCPKIEEVVDKILNFMDDSILVAHNASFDVPFFNSVLTRLDKDQLSNKSLCTNLMTKYLIPEIMNSNLNYMSRIFDITHQKAHRALEDAKATAELLINYLHIFAKKGIWKINQLYYPRNKFELNRLHFKEDDSKEEIIQILEEIDTPMSILLKGKEGLVLSYLPLINPKEEIEFIKKFLNETEYKSLTLQLMSSFYEGLLKLNLHFNKIAEETRNEILDYLFSKHLKFTDSRPDFVKFNELEAYHYDFLITPHLIPEQFVIYPIAALTYKNGLVFRYPGHKKKLFQYVIGQSKRMGKDRSKGAQIIHNSLTQFYYLYLESIYQSKKSSTFFFKKSIATKSPHEFKDLIHKFMTKNQKSTGYPQKHI